MPPKNANPAPAAKATKSVKTSTKPATKATPAGPKPGLRKMGAARPAPKKAPTPKVKVEAAAPAAEAASPVAGTAASVPVPADPPQPTSATIGLKSFAKYLMDDKDTDLKKSGRWPIISDETERSTTFLQYRNVNMLNVLNQNDMEPNRIRLALIGGLRYGKPVVFNMMTSSLDAMYPRLVEYVDAVKPGLMKAIIDKEFLKEDYYMQLVKEEDGTEYKALNFNDTFMENFMVILASGTKDFPEEIVQDFFIVTVE